MFNNFLAKCIVTILLVVFSGLQSAEDFMVERVLIENDSRFDLLFAKEINGHMSHFRALRDQNQFTADWTMVYPLNFSHIAGTLLQNQSYKSSLIIGLFSKNKIVSAQKWVLNCNDLPYRIHLFIEADKDALKIDALFNEKKKAKIECMGNVDISHLHYKYDKKD